MHRYLYQIEFETEIEIKDEDSHSLYAGVPVEDYIAPILRKHIPDFRKAHFSWPKLIKREN
jgi:hypothetical protein